MWLKRTFILLLTLLAAAAVIAGLFLTGVIRIQSVDDYYLSHIDDITPESETVTLTIRCDTVLDHYSSLPASLQSDEFVPPDGVILQQTTYVLRPDDTAFDVLERAARYHKIQLDCGGGASGGTYVRGIHSLYEFSCGPLSGWSYSVNGVFPGESSDAYALQDGDEIAFLYTCDAGRDVGNPNAFAQAKAARQPS